jgi:hypothetical protein
LGNGVVRIRVEGVSITIVGGSITIEQTGTEVPTVDAVPKVDEGLAALSRQALPESPGSLVQASPTTGAVPASAVVAGTALPESPNPAPAINAPHRPLPPRRNGRAGLSGASGKGREAPSGQTKPAWTDEEIEKLRALYPTHSAGAIAVELGRGLNSVRAKAQRLGLRKDGPAVTVSSPREAKPSPKPRPLSAAVTADPAPAGTAFQAVPVGFSAVPLLDHRPGQCRWIISDVWPAVYCGAPVVDSSSWCSQHSRRVFTADGERQRRAARESK